MTDEAATVVERHVAAPAAGEPLPRNERRRRDARSNKGFLTGTEETRGAIELAETFYKTPALTTQFTRCGKAACRCNDGRLHGPYAVLRWREGGHQRRRYVKLADIERVRAVVERRRAERIVTRSAFADDMALLRRLDRLRRDLDALLAAEVGSR